VARIEVDRERENVMVYELVRRLFPKKSVWVGEGTWRVHWGGQWLCRRPGCWRLQLKGFGHNLQWGYPESRGTPNRHWRDKHNEIHSIVWGLFFILSFLFIGFLYC
jgi:hypothetical protein